MKLAEYMTELVHGPDALSSVKLATDFLFKRPFQPERINEKMLHILDCNARVISTTTDESIARLIESRCLIPDYGNFFNL